jgi:hypothetical protein
MSSPVVGGIIACWMQAFPRLSYRDVMEAIAATSRQPDPSLTYPNNLYGYGEIDAEAGLQYLFNKYGMEDGISRPATVPSRDGGEVFDLSGRRMEKAQFKKGIYIVNGRKVLF